MKNLFLISMAAFALISCNKDDENHNLIEGKWSLFSTETIRRDAVNTQIDKDTLKERREVLEFLPNGVFKIEDNQGIYTIAGDSLHITVVEGQDQDRASFKFSVDEDNLMFSITESWSETSIEDIHRYKRL